MQGCGNPQSLVHRTRCADMDYWWLSDGLQALLQCQLRYLEQITSRKQIIVKMFTPGTCSCTCNPKIGPLEKKLLWASFFGLWQLLHNCYLPLTLKPLSNIFLTQLLVSLPNIFHTVCTELWKKLCTLNIDLKSVISSGTILKRLCDLQVK